MKTKKAVNDLPILLIDDEEHMLKSLSLSLKVADIPHIISCGDSREVMPMLEKQEVALVLLDISMPYISGEKLLEQIVISYPYIPVIMITGVNEVDVAVKCMKTGAFDYMLKPVERDRLISGVKRALEITQLKRENVLLKEMLFSSSLKAPSIFSKVVTQDKKMYSIFKYVEMISETDQPVLITGETGVGKELIAQIVHRASKRKGKFVAVNVAGLDETLFSDTLFGHQKGGFTGADKSRKGMIEAASDGTIFLDEIGDLSLPSQVKLLRLLQEKEYLPIGADMIKKSNARVVVATNKDIVELKDSKAFRRDLYYRLYTHHIHIPPLRERLGDLPLLIHHFLEKAAKALKKKRPTAPDELITLLSTYAFPGNVRELEAMIFNAVSKHQSKKMSLAVFKEAIQLEQENKTDNRVIGPDNLISFSSYQLPTFKQAEKILLDEAMKRAKNNQSIAAQMLGVTRQALNKRLKSK